VAKTSKKKATNRPVRRAAVPKAPAARTRKQPLVTTQPQSKQQAAVKAGMFLYTDDAWSLRYFDDGDLHSMERELFG
jgi:hypothetical protein